MTTSDSAPSMIQAEVLGNDPATHGNPQRRDTIRPIRWRDGVLALLDQRELPKFEKWLTIQDFRAGAQAIRDLVVRGAPAIGICAAFSAVLAARERWLKHGRDWRAGFERDLDELADARPTAVNLRWALERMRHVSKSLVDNPESELTDLALSIWREDVEGNYRMGDFGAALLPQGGGVLTHCNTGSLATGGYGTALGVIRSAWRQERIARVYAGETRPWLQGARLTAWELQQDGIPVSLIADSAAAYLMSKGDITAVVVGADRVAENGDVANKIGTYALAVAARTHGIPMMVAAPTSTIDPHTASGSAIPIEERDASELLHLAGQRVAAEGARAVNPVFDLTPAEWVTFLVTEFGVIASPDRQKIRAHLQKHAD